MKKQLKSALDAYLKAETKVDIIAKLISFSDTDEERKVLRNRMKDAIETRDNAKDALFRIRNIFCDYYHLELITLKQIIVICQF